MSDCCANHNKENKKKEEVKVDNKPRSFIGKYLYKLGKEEAEKDKHKRV